MSGTQKPQIPRVKPEMQEKLDEILNFGPDHSSQDSHAVTERIRAIVKKLEEINQRIDKLSLRF